MNNPIIKARFMRQHKDRAVYEREIVLDSPTLTQEDTLMPASFVFEIPLLLDVEPKWMFRWLNSDCLYRISHRVLRFMDSDGTILYELSKRPLKANIPIPENFDGAFLTIRICCIVEKDEIKELAKIFFPKYFED